MEIRIAGVEDLDFASECTAVEGWAGETREALESLFLHNREGFFVAEEDGRRVGICAATSYGKMGFIGELIVRRETRGRGIGPKLLEHAVSYLRERGARSISLDGVGRAVPFYESAGFRMVCRSLRFLGALEGRERPDVRPMREADFNEVASLDLRAFGADRSFFLRRRFKLYPRFCLILESPAGITGFIMGLGGRGIVSAGPWIVAEQASRPIALLEGLALKARDTPIRIGALESNKAAVSTLLALPGFRPQHPSFRMVLGSPESPGLGLACWAVGSPAKG